MPNLIKSEKIGTLDKKVKVLRDYQEKIVDLSRRNRLLKYPMKARRVSFDLTPKELQERFGVIEDFSIDFLHKFVLRQDDDQLSLLNNKKAGQEKNDLPVTVPKGEKLLNTFSSLRLDAKRKFEEHGLNTLFLTIGRAQWKEKLAGKGSSEVKNEWDFNAPLLLIPIKIEELKQPVKKTVVRPDLNIGGISINPVLLLLLENEYKIVPRDLEIPEEILDISVFVSKLISKFERAFSDSKIEHKIDADIEIGQYSFYGQQIYEDLKNHEQEISNNPFISALCEHNPLLQASISDSEFNPEKLLEVREDYSVMDADISQLNVIERVLEGRSMVVQGPPGTGKSQTIVNLVSNLLARGKKILVVCEKQVALEVVLKRLKSVDLDKLCLPLFQYNADKSRFAKSIINDRNFIIRNYSSEDRSIHNSLILRQKSIDKLKAYARALSKVVEPLGKNIFWVHGELSRVQSVSSSSSISWKGSDPSQITFTEYQELLVLFENLMPFLKKKQNNQIDYWQHIKRKHFSPDYASRVFQVVEALKNSLSKIKAVEDNLIPIHSIQNVKNAIANSEETHQILELKAEDVQINTEVDLKKGIDTLKMIIKVASDYDDLNRSFGSKYTVPESWIDQKCELFNTIDNQILLSKVEKTVDELSDTSEDFKSIKRYVLKTQIAYFLDDPFSDLLKYTHIFALDPVIKKLVSWKDINSLKSAIENLNVLNIIYQKLESAKLVFEKRAIAFSELDKQSATEIADRFIRKYKYFFRYFFPSYRKDCRTVISWCGINEPVKYSDFKTIVSSVQDCYHLSQKFELLLGQYNEKWISKEEPLKAAAVPILYANVSRLITWFQKENKEEIPVGVFEFVKDRIGSQELHIFENQIIKIGNIIDNSWKALGFGNELSFDVINEKRKRLGDTIESVVSVQEKILPLLAEKHPQNIGELKTLAGKINQLSDVMHKVARSDIDLVFTKGIKFESIVGLRDKIALEISKIESILHSVSKLVPKIETYKIIDFINLVKKIDKQNLSWKEILSGYEHEIGNLNSLFENEKSLIHLEDFLFDKQIQALSEMVLDQAGLENQINYVKYSYALEEKGYGWFVKIIRNKSDLNLPATFAQSLWNAWLEWAYQENIALRDFNVVEHRKTMLDFKSLEAEVLKVNAKRVMACVGPSIRENKYKLASSEKFLLHQSELQRSHKSIRRVVTECAGSLQDYKPCWMMSPLTLSSYIPYGKMEFDVVIFDEASQMRVEHALGTIARAKQVVIFGDEHQLPPTSFFDISSDDEDEAEENQFESILHASKTILPGADKSLLYHYRSKYEDLIAFSNQEVYRGDLVTFPNPTTARGVEFIYVENGVFDGAVSKEKYAGTRRNDIEAKKVAEVCVKCAVDYPNKSIGVIAFSRSQEVAIRDAVIESLKNNPEAREKLNEDDTSTDAFFIKNLESVQGDERDIIVLSIGYGKDKNGQVHNRFGPINGKNGYRRLNVAFTRAKEKVVCVSSMKASDIKPGEGVRGVKMLQKYLEYAENGTSTLVASKLVEGSLGDADSPFEVDVARALIDRGYDIKPQIGASGFKIDLAIVDPKDKGRYVLGIECDGATYHSSYSARVNDRLRQDILEKLDWKIYRIWSQHWITHKNEIIEDVIKLIS